MMLTHLLTATACHHVVSVNPIPCTTPMIAMAINVVALAAAPEAALEAALHVAHPVVTNMTMIAAAADPLALAMTTMLGIMTLIQTLQKTCSTPKLDSTIALMDPLSHMAIG